MVAHHRQRHQDLEFGASLVYTKSSRTARTAKRDPVSNKQTKLSRGMVPESSLNLRPASVERVGTGLGATHKGKGAEETTQKD